MVHAQVRLRVEWDGAAEEWTFGDGFRIGRGPACEVQVDAGLVSRVHAEVTPEATGWWVRDLDSTNGTFLDDERITRAPLRDGARLRLGREGPELHVRLLEADRAAVAARRTTQRDRPVESAARPTPGPATGPATPAAGSTLRPSSKRKRPPIPVEPSSERNVGDPNAAGPDDSVDDYIAKYFGPREGPAGMHTRMIRSAYAEVHKRHRRRFVWAIAAILGVLLLVGGYAAYQQVRVERLEGLAAEAFYDLRAIEAEVMRLKHALVESQNTSLTDLLLSLERRRGRSRQTYEEYIEALGVRDGLSAEDRVIHRMAYVFNESEAEIPPDFKREVWEGIRFWTVQNRTDYVEAIRRAEENGYTEYIVRTMQRYGLPPQFFYLALQESKFFIDQRAVGPPTNYGYAKGMWQFIPSTARKYGLDIGTLWEYGQYAQDDERFDVAKSTAAAARYLQYIYGTLAQASGLLVMASYNWGEHRVGAKLDQLPEELPEDRFREALEDVPDDPRARSYWRFYGEYSDRMPEQTKDYVIKIFAAAVIGENPRLFGFDFDNPLAKYMDDPAPARP